MNEKKVKKLLSDILKSRRITCSSIAKTMEVNARNVSNQINGDTDLSLSVLIAALNAVPDISAEWLLREEGPMLRNDMGNNVTNDNHSQSITVGDNNSSINASVGSSNESTQLLIQEVSRLNQELSKIMDQNIKLTQRLLGDN